MFSLLTGGLCVFLTRKNPGKHRVRDRRRHLGRVRKLVWGEQQSDRGGGGIDCFQSRDYPSIGRHIGAHHM